MLSPWASCLVLVQLRKSEKTSRRDSKLLTGTLSISTNKTSIDPLGQIENKSVSGNGLKILDRVGTHIFYIILFLEKI